MSLTYNLFNVIMVKINKDVIEVHLSSVSILRRRDSVEG